MSNLVYTYNICIEQPWDSQNGFPIPGAGGQSLAYMRLWLLICLTDQKVRLPVLWKHLDYFFVSGHTFVSSVQIIFWFCNTEFCVTVRKLQQ